MGGTNSTIDGELVPKNEYDRRYWENMGYFWENFNIENHIIYKTFQLAVVNNPNSFSSWDGTSPFTPGLFYTNLREGKSIGRNADYAYGIIFSNDDKPERIRLSFNECYMEFDVDACQKITVTINESNFSDEEINRIYEGRERPQPEIITEEMYVLPIHRIPLQEAPYTDIRFCTIGDEFKFNTAKVVHMFLQRGYYNAGGPMEHKTKLAGEEVSFHSNIGAVIPAKSYNIRTNKGLYTKAARN